MVGDLSILCYKWLGNWVNLRGKRIWSQNLRRFSSWGFLLKRYIIHHILAVILPIFFKTMFTLVIIKVAEGSYFVVRLACHGIPIVLEILRGTIQVGGSIPVSRCGGMKEKSLLPDFPCWDILQFQFWQKFICIIQACLDLTQYQVHSVLKIIWTTKSFISRYSNLSQPICYVWNPMVS